MTTSRSRPLRCKRCKGVRVLINRRHWVCPDCGSGISGVPTHGEREYLVWLRDKRASEALTHDSTAA
jgi:hypothetical protein